MWRLFYVWYRKKYFSLFQDFIIKYQWFFSVMFIYLYFIFNITDNFMLLCIFNWYRLIHKIIPFNVYIYLIWRLFHTLQEVIPCKFMYNITLWVFFSGFIVSNTFVVRKVFFERTLTIITLKLILSTALKLTLLHYAFKKCVR